MKVDTLRRWQRELRKKTDDAPSPRLLPVVVKDARSLATQPGRGGDMPSLEVLVEIGATRMTLRGGVSTEHLAALVTAAARAC